MATIRILLGIIWLAALGSGWGANSNTIASKHIDESRKKVVAVAQKEIGVKESGENSGARVDEYNTYTGHKKVPWCASFVSWCFAQAGCLQPRTAWSPALFPSSRLVKEPSAGTVLAIYSPELKRIAHCGMVEQVKNDWVLSIEGNTNVNGGREGDGVYREEPDINGVFIGFRTGVEIKDHQQ